MAVNPARGKLNRERAMKLPFFGDYFVWAGGKWLIVHQPIFYRPVEVARPKKNDPPFSTDSIAGTFNMPTSYQ